jgi:hypothetical protein
MRNLVLTLSVVLFLLAPGLALLSDVVDPAMRGPGIPRRARAIHASITPRITRWALERIETGRAAEAALHDVPTTEWPMFTAVFYLMGTEELERAWEREGRVGDEPRETSREAITAARDLLLDPSHHTWVRTHWGEDYLHEQNVFFRSLLIAGLTSYENLTRDGTTREVLLDQVSTLSAELDASPLGVLEDYPTECYPIDVLAAIGLIERADRTLGTDHGAFLARSRRGF